MQLTPSRIIKSNRSSCFSSDHKKSVTNGRKSRKIFIEGWIWNLKISCLVTVDIILLTYSDIKTYQQILYLITFFTISEEGIIVFIPALNTCPIISTRNFRINGPWRVRIPRAVRKQAKFIITQHHHSCSTHYALWNKVRTYTHTPHSFWTPSVIQYLKEKIIKSLSLSHDLLYVPTKESITLPNKLHCLRNATK